MKGSPWYLEEEDFHYVLFHQRPINDVGIETETHQDRRNYIIYANGKIQELIDSDEKYHPFVFNKYDMKI